MRHGSLILLLALIAAAPLLLGSSIASSQAPGQFAVTSPSNTTVILSIPIPAASPDASIRVIIGGQPGYTLVVDKNYNGVIDEGEDSFRGPLRGEIAYTIAVPNEPPQSPTLLQLIAVGGNVNALVTIKSQGHNAAYAAPLPGRVLLAPPLPGRLLIAAYEGDAVNVSIGDASYLVKKGTVLEVCKPANVTYITSNGSIAGVLYDFNYDAWWATELLPSTLASNPVIGFSSMQVSTILPEGTVYAFLIYTNGSHASYKVDRAAVAIHLPGEGVVYYALYRDGRLLDVAPEYPGRGFGYEGGGALYLGSRGFLDGEYAVVNTRGSTSTVTLIDVDGDGEYEVYSPGDGYGAGYYRSTNTGRMLVVSDRGMPLIVEGAGDPALYEVLFPRSGLATASSYYSYFSGEAWTLSLAEQGGFINASIAIVPRSIYGNARVGVIAAFTPNFTPIHGTARRLAAVNDTLGSLAAYTLIMESNVESGFYIGYMIVYQSGIGTATIFRSPPPLQEYNASQPPEARVECTAPRIVDGYKAFILAGGASYTLPLPREVRLDKYADLFNAASTQPPATTTTTTTNTPATTFETITVNQTKPPVPRSAPPIYLIGVVALIVALGVYAAYTVAKGKSNS